MEKTFILRIESNNEKEPKDILEEMLEHFDLKTHDISSWSFDELPNIWRME